MGIKIAKSAVLEERTSSLQNDRNPTACNLLMHIDLMIRRHNGEKGFSHGRHKDYPWLYLICNSALDTKWSQTYPKIGLVSLSYFIFFRTNVNYLITDLNAFIPHLGKGKPPNFKLI